MKIKINLLLIAFITCATYAQKTYLKVTKSNDAYDYELYPPGTKFELKNKHGYIIFKNSDDPGSIEITEKHTLYVYPSWKDEPTIYKLTEGRVEKLLTHRFTDSNTNIDATSASSNGVTATSKVTESETIEGQKNLEFTLSNGITFAYTDGIYSATLGEKILSIKYKYLVYSDLGVLKLSFNATTGKVWWVFEPTKE
ncbi:hypothetical protein [Winogradskyella sp.]|uniref:hypothetical protein n=1 Tax=Winogradskyella sp. TaxID=1883156 RepID=UPI003BADA26A